MLASAEPATYGRPGASTADVLQEVLDRAVGGMRYAASEVDKLSPDEFWVHKVDAQGNTLAEPNKWYQLEVAARAEVERIAGLMSQLGIAERLVQVEEAKATLIIAAIRDAARDAGLDNTSIRKLGSALRGKLAESEAVA
jgi:hypothetical protein